MVDRAWIEGDRVGASLLEVLNKKRLKRESIIQIVCFMFHEKD